MQSCLEKKGIESRNNLVMRNDYNKEDEYNSMHPDALSTGDPQGKGTRHGGHTFSIPNCNIPSVIDYRNFDTINGGGQYDVEARERAKTMSLYNEINDYSHMSIDMDANVAEGQIQLSV